MAFIYLLVTFICKQIYCSNINSVSKQDLTMQSGAADHGETLEAGRSDMARANESRCCRWDSIRSNTNS